MTELRRTPLHRALHRPALMLGGERSLVLTSMGICFALVVSATNLPAVIFAVIVWPSSLIAFRMMAKSDPQLFAVWKKANFYRGYIPPVATIHAPEQIHRRDKK